MEKNLILYNEDCIFGSNKIKDQSIDLLICDPPFGINETSFHKHYNRNESNIIDGYQEAPNDYYQFTLEWMSSANNILKNTGTFYIISGWTNLNDILTVGKKLNLTLTNHCIWKFNFGVNTSKKWVTSHYHVLMYNKSNNYTFNTNCRFGQSEKDKNNKSLLYKDLEDVFVINKEFHHDEIKNKNKLPTELIDKLILYSSNENDVVCDFFMGNFTTAYSALNLGRKVIGFEINKNSYDYHYDKLLQIKFGNQVPFLKKIANAKPKNQGQKISEVLELEIISDFNTLKKKHSKKDSILILCKKYERGYFSIFNILKKHKL